MLFNQTAADRKVRVFSLSPDFLEKFKGKQPEWGAVGYFTFKRTYARLVDPDDPDSRTEEFWETLKRVVEGCYNIQKIHCRQYSLPWQEQKAQKSAQEMFEKMWAFKFLPPGRGLWMMGTDVVYDRGAASLQNCFAGDTEIITKDGIVPIGTVAGTTQTILTTDGSWVEAPIKSFGKQKLSKVRLRKVWDDIEKDVYCTRNHRWFTSQHVFSFGEKIMLGGIPAIETTTAKMGGGARLLSVYPDTGVGDPEWCVMDICSSDREEDVYCATVENHGAFALEGNILTGNCAFVSSEGISEDFADPFCFLMDMSMLGVGTGADTKGEGRVKIQKPRTTEEPHIVEDSREGWVELIRVVLNSFVGKGHFPLYIDYTKVRGRGVPLKTFGGKASGPKPLQDMVENLTQLLLPKEVKATFEVPYDHTTGKIEVVETAFEGEGDPYRIPSSHIVDIFNFIGKGVVAGGIRRCLPKGTLVHTSKGLLPIEDVKMGMSVVTSQGMSKVTDWVEQGCQSITSITTQMGNFECTDRHKIAVISDVSGGYVWKKAFELESGDRMVFVDHVMEGCTTSLPPFHYDRPKHSTTCKDIVVPDLDSDLGWLLGLFHGDGYVKTTVGKGYVSVAIAEGQEDILYKAKRQLERFGIHVGILDPSEDNKCYKIQVSSKQLGLYLEQFKQAKVPLNVPKCVMQGLPEIRGSYVAGLFDADGSSRNRPLVAVESVYPSYLEQVQALLASLGVPSRIKLHKDEEREKKGWQPLYLLNIVGEKAVSRWQQRVSHYSLKYEDGRKTTRSGQDYGFPSKMALDCGVTGYLDGNMRWSRQSRQITVARLEMITGRNVDLVPVEVFDIEHGVRTDETYDISVDAGEFVAQGGYLVHNTAEIMFGEPDDEEFLELKQDKEALEDRRWASNNSVFAYRGMDYSAVAERIADNGEPGVFWLENAQQFSRMDGVPDNRDWRAAGLNPCFSGDTLIAVADGRDAVPIKQLAEEGFDVPVYSVDKKTGMVEIKWGRNPRKTRKQAELVEIEFECGNTLRVTPDHKMLLLDGTEIKAAELQKGDSLPRLTKRQEKIKSGSPHLYWRINCNTRDGRDSRVFEHRLIARFHNEDKWDALYQSGKKTGWKTGGVVVHHKNDSLDNHPDNLEIMTHQKLHANLADVSGEKNPMWGRNHSQETRRKIGDKTKERCKDPKYLERLSTSVTVEDRNNSSRRLSQRRKTELLEYYKEQESRTDLNTVWKDGRLYAVRNCEVCGNEMVLPWRIREQACCSRSCSNRMGSTTKARTKGQRAYFAEKSRQTLHNQVMVFKNLEGGLGRTPLKKEWEYRCRQEGVPVRFQKETPNPHILSGYQELKEVAAGYNHRVKSVKNVVGQEDVFNITVDDFHTVGVVFKNDNSSNISGIFTPQCGEQPLESHEMCNLVETFPAHHDTYEDYERTLKMAYLYAKTVTLVPTHVPRANAVMTRNRRIGCSMSGIIQAMVKLGRRSFLEWCDNGYDYIQKLDRIYSDWLGVPLSIKTTTVKPSGTTSLLCGATPGIHFPHSPFYIRHIRVADTSPLVDACREAGYQVEPDPYADNTFVVAFPVKEKHFVKGKREATIWEQFLNAADMQRYWANNAVSVTVTFNHQEVRDIRSCLETFEDRLKGVSMLPLSDDDHGYKFAPYVSITEDEYNQMVARISPINMSNSKHEVDDKFCSADKCEIPLKR